jgi:hypothetical protein
VKKLGAISVYFLGVLGFLFPQSLVFAQKNKPDKAISSLILAEKAFQQDMALRGQKLAYLNVLSDKSLVFRPVVSPGIHYYQTNKNPEGDLNWDPVWVEVSKDGYMGYTTGPYRYSNQDTTTYGDYVSIWIKEPYKTKWKLFVDGGDTHSKPVSSNPPLSYPSIITQDYPSIYPGIIDQSKDILLTTDILFATLMSTRTAVQAYEDYLTPDARLLEDGQNPVRGRDSILTNLASHKGYLVFRPSASFVGYSNDLGFTHGTGDFVDMNRKTHKDKKFSYLRIWRLGVDGLWRIALELRMKKD